MVFGPSNYHKLIPTTVGFEPLFKELTTIYNLADQPKYPPHNIVKTENGYVIELAVAGWAADELSVTVEENKLKVCGEKPEDDRDYNHKGIAQRSFERIWVLGANIKVESSNLDNGILSIKVKEDLPNVQKVDIMIGQSSEPSLLLEGE